MRHPHNHHAEPYQEPRLFRMFYNYYAKSRFRSNRAPQNPQRRLKFAHSPRKKEIKKGKSRFKMGLNFLPFRKRFISLRSVQKRACSVYLAVRRFVPCSSYTTDRPERSPTRGRRRPKIENSQNIFPNIVVFVRALLYSKQQTRRESRSAEPQGPKVDGTLCSVRGGSVYSAQSHSRQKKKLVFSSKEEKQQFGSFGLSLCLGGKLLVCFYIVRDRKCASP